MTKHHAYVIHWEDSSTLAGWRYVEQAQRHKPDRIVSIGWLVHETKTAVTITTSMGSGGECMDVLSIPKAAILKRTRLDRYIAGA